MHRALLSRLVAPYQLSDAMTQTVLTAGGFFRFIVVRDPISRFVSCYLDRISGQRSAPRRRITRQLVTNTDGKISFDAFLAAVEAQDVREMDPHWKPQYFAINAHVIRFDEVLRFERLQEDMSTVMAKIYPRVWESIDLTRNWSPSRTCAADAVADLVTPGARRQLAKLYEADFEAFGYRAAV